MLRKKDNVSLKDFEKFGFKYGTRDRFIYKTTTSGVESKIYISLLPCHNNNNEIKVECLGGSIPSKIVDKLYDLIKADLIEKAEDK